MKKLKQLFVVVMILFGACGCASWPAHQHKPMIHNYSGHNLRLLENGFDIGLVCDGEVRDLGQNFLGPYKEVTYDIQLVRLVDGKLRVIDGKHWKVQMQQSGYGGSRNYDCTVRMDPYQKDQLILQY